MKKILITLLLSVSAFANTVDLKIDLTSKIPFLTYTKVAVVYESTSTSRSCTRFSGDIFSDRSPKYFEKYISLSNGVFKGKVKSALIECDAKLISIDLDTKIDRQALAQELGLRMSDIDKNRLTFNFHITKPAVNDVIYNPELSFEKLYVAGRSQPLITLYSRAEIAPIINGVIDLTL
jgi:hypothetical protein